MMSLAKAPRRGSISVVRALAAHSVSIPECSGVYAKNRCDTGQVRLLLLLSL
jgi:hypothetical protein